MLKFCAVALIFLGVHLMLREYIARSERRISELSEVCALTEQLSREVKLRMRPFKEIIESFVSSGCSAGLGQILLSGGVNAEKSVLFEEDLVKLRQLLCGFGKEYRQGEVERIESAGEYFEKRRAEQYKAYEREKKIYPLLLLGAAAGVLILIL